MTYTYNFPETTNGLDDIITGMATEIPSLPPSLLLFVFFTVFLGGTIAQKKRSGFSDVPMWSTMASISTLLITLAFTLKTGFIDLPILSVVVSITIASGLWLFLDKGRLEN